MNRKKLIAYDWVQGLLMALAFGLLVAVGCWAAWFVYNLAWAFKCAFGV